MKGNRISLSKTLLLALLALVMAVLFSACAPATQPPTEAPEKTEAPEETATVEASPTPGEPVDVTIWAQATVTEAAAPPDDWVAYDVIRKDLNINLHYVIIPTGADGEAKLNAAAAANELPDLFQMTTANQDSRGQLFQYVDLGVVAPVEDLMPLMPNRAATHYNDPLLINLVTKDGHQYGFPEPPPLPRREGLVIRKDWLEKLELAEPTNLDELLVVAKAFTEQDPDGNGQADTYGFGGFINGDGLGTRFEFLFGAYGVPGTWNFSSADDFALNVRNPDYPEALGYMKSLVDEGVIDPDWPTLTRDDFRARWKQGKFGIMWEDFAALTNKSNYKPFDDNFPEGEWTPVASPTGPDGDAYYGVYTGRGQIFAVSTKAMDDGKGDAIASLLEWMSKEDGGYYLLGFGEEGVNFNLDADGNVTTEGLAPEEAWTAPERQPFTQMRNQLIYYNTPAEIKARYPSYTADSGREMDPISFLTFFQSQPWVDGRGVQVILPPANAADFTRFYNEGLISFVLGQKPLDEASWTEFLNGLDGLGAKEYEASAKQALIDAGLLK